MVLLNWFSYAMVELIEAVEQKSFYSCDRCGFLRKGANLAGGDMK